MILQKDSEIWIYLINNLQILEDLKSQGGIGNEISTILIQNYKYQHLYNSGVQQDTDHQDRVVDINLGVVYIYIQTNITIIITIYFWEMH